MMTVWPAPGVTASRLAEVLRHVHSSASNAFNGPASVQDVPEQYLRWVVEQEPMLRSVLTPQDVARLLLTDRYWATQANPAYSAPVVLAVRQEVQARERDLDEAMQSALKLAARWESNDGHTFIVVADTNVYLHHPDSIEHLDWRALIGISNLTLADVRVVLPLVVVDELDDLKRTDLRSRARQTLKIIYEWFGSDVTRRRVVSRRAADTGQATAELLLDPDGHVRLARADDELIDRAARLQSLSGRTIHFVSYDTGAVFRAKAAGLAAHRLHHGA